MRLVDTFKASLDPYLFRLYRRYLYSRYKATDELAQAEVVHEKAKESLLKMTDKFMQNRTYFDPGDQLVVEIENHRLKSRSEEHTSELQSRLHLVCRLLL